MNWAILVALTLLIILFQRPLKRVWKLAIIIGNTVPTPIRPLISALSRTVTLENGFYRTGKGDHLPLRMHHPNLRKICPAIIIYPGASPAGEEHEAMNQLARSLAKAGFRVFLPRIPELKEVLLREESVDQMIDVFHEVRNREDVDRSKVVVVGMSFGGSLLIKASVHPRMKGKPAAVLSYGSYFNLEKTLEFALTGDFTDGTHKYHLKPNEWGRIAFFHNFLEYLEADFNLKNIRSYFLERIRDDQEAADEVYKTLPKKDRQFIDMIMEGDGQEAILLAQEVLPKVKPIIKPISPSDFVDDIDFPIFLMHGANDTMIPFTETVIFDKALRKRGRPVTTFISYLYSHSEVEGHGKSPLGFINELWKFGQFINKALSMAFPND